MMLRIVDQVLIAGFGGLLLWAAACDARRFVIPNRIVLALGGLWLAWAALRLVAGAPGAGLLAAGGIGLAAFAAGGALFALRLIGGGDAKLFAAAALWAGPGLILSLVFATLIAGGALALGYLAMRVTRGLAAAPAPAARPSFGVALMGALRAPVPFGVAIAAGGLTVAFALFGQISGQMFGSPLP